MEGKKRGHYCKGCADFLPNEKFSGKGHREHLCKDCKRNGIKVDSELTADYDRNLNRLSKAIRNCLIVYTPYNDFFLFEYQRFRYITSDDLESEIYVYEKNTKRSFLLSENLQQSEVLMEVLYKKYHETLDSGHVLDYEEILEDEDIEISKKRRQHLEVIFSLHQLM